MKGPLQGMLPITTQIYQGRFTSILPAGGFFYTQSP